MIRNYLDGGATVADGRFNAPVDPSISKPLYTELYVMYIHILYNFISRFLINE